MATSRKKAAKTPAAELIPAPKDYGAEVAEALKAVGAPIIDVQADARATLEKASIKSRSAIMSANEAAEESTHALEKSFVAARDGVAAINAKAFESFRANTEANIDFIKAALTVKSPSDLLTLQSEFVRMRADALADQTKDLGTLAQKTFANTMDPIKDQITKSFKTAL